MTEAAPATPATPAGCPDRIHVGSLRGTFSPRIGREDLSHARALAEVIDDLPPIVVHAATHKVIDGMHRVLAARLAGRDWVRVSWFTGTEEDAAIEAIRLNRTHGRPLTLRERREAARRLLTEQPHWSDRRIAELCALSPKTVAAVRAANDDLPRPPVRVGRDGRARHAPRSERRAPASANGASPAEPEQVDEREAPEIDLRSDPAIRASGIGADLAALFAGPPTGCRTDPAAIAASTPLSRVYVLADEARRRSRWWAQLADALENRATT